MKYLVRAAIASIVLLPAFASAQSDTSAALINQAQSLLQQIQQLQAQISAAGQGPTGGGPAQSGGACISGAAIRPGQSGADVSALQQFLAADPSIYPEGKVTGYYGALTQAAVKRWQAAHGIVSSGSPSTTGYGSVGPKTAAAMRAACGGSGGPVVAGFIKISPVTGNAPLQVSADASINTAKSCAAAVYTIDWGDGSAVISIAVPANTCDVLEQTYTHTYTVGGQYTVTLASGAHATTATVNVSGVGGTTTGSLNAGTITTTTAGTGSTGAGQVVSGSLAISMTNSHFSPSVATITSGTRVTWTNQDSMPHTVTADNNSYNSGDIDQGKTYSLTFTQKGEYTYYCAYHGGPGGQGMSGKIIVQ